MQIILANPKYNVKQPWCLILELFKLLLSKGQNSMQLLKNNDYKITILFVELVKH